MASTTDRNTQIRSFTARVFAGVSVLAHALRRCAHLNFEGRVVWGDPHRPSGRFGQIECIPVLEVEPRQRFLWQYDSQRVSDRANLEQRHGELSNDVITNIITRKRFWRQTIK